MSTSDPISPNPSDINGQDSGTSETGIISETQDTKFQEQPHIQDSEVGDHPSIDHAIPEEGGKEEAQTQVQGKPNDLGDSQETSRPAQDGASDNPQVQSGKQPVAASAENEPSGRNIAPASEDMKRSQAPVNDDVASPPLSSQSSPEEEPTPSSTPQAVSTDPSSFGTAPLPSIPTPRSDSPPIPVRPIKRRHHSAPRKSILKIPPPPSNRFSFRRDILLPLNSRIAYAYPQMPTMGGADRSRSVLPGQQTTVSAAGGFLSNAFKKFGAAAAGWGAQDGVGGGAGGPPAGSSGLGSTAGSGGEKAVSSPMHASFSDPVTPSSPGQGSVGNPANSNNNNNNVVTVLGVDSLKKVRFTMSSLTVVYPINAPMPPSEEAVTRDKVESEHRQRHVSRASVPDTRGWSASDLLALYDECCRTQEEPATDRIRRVLSEAANQPSDDPPKVMDLTGELLTHGCVDVLSDLLSVDFGLKKLVLENCGVDDDSLKPLLNALLVSGTLPTLSLANNRRIKVRGWRLVAVFVRKARSLRFLDLSDNPIDKKSIDYLVQSLQVATPTSAPSKPSVSPLPPSTSSSIHRSTSVMSTPGVLKTPAELSQSRADSSSVSINGSHILHVNESDGTESITSPTTETPQIESPKNENASLDLSNSIDSVAAEEIESSSDEEPLNPVAPLLREDEGIPSQSGLTSLRLENCSLKNHTLEALANGVRVSGVQNVSLRRNRITQLGAVAVALLLRDYPVSTDPNVVVDQLPPSPSPSSANPTRSNTMSTVSSLASSNSVTARKLPPPYIPREKEPRRVLPPAPPSMGSGISSQSQSQQSQPPINGTQRESSPPSTSSETTKEPSSYYDEEDSIGPEKTSRIAAAIESKRASEARLQLKRKIDEMPRIGSLRVLDIKSNDIRGGVVYIAQVLKRNRTLRVLNLSENKIDSAGLASIAEALKYNSVLETLDLSRNPCCGPALDGILSLRSALVINGDLKRIYLNATDLSTEGAICLAEFLPDAKGLIQLDLAENHGIEMAGVLALAVSLKMNKVIRCLDLDIPPNDPDFAHLSQDLLQTCSRNTQLAQDELDARGIKHHVAAPMAKSAVARNLKMKREQEKSKVRAKGVDNGPQRMVPASRRTQSQETMEAAEECSSVLEEVLDADEAIFVREGVVTPSAFVKDLLEQGKATQAQLQEVIQGLKGERLDRAKLLETRLTNLFQRSTQLYERPQHESGQSGIPHRMPADGEAITSPSFSLGDSDEDSSEDESPPKQKKNGKDAGLTVDIPHSRQRGEDMPRSPTGNHSRTLTLEEGEVFRKGAALNAVNDEDEDKQEVSGEVLRKEILETEVERVPRTSPGAESPSFEARDSLPTPTPIPDGSSSSLPPPLAT